MTQPYQPLDNMLHIPASMLEFLMRNGMLREVGERKPTVNDVKLQKKKVRMKTEEAIKKLTKYQPL